MDKRGLRGAVHPACQTVAQRESYIKKQAIKEQSRLLQSEIQAKNKASAEIRELAGRREEVLMLAVAHLTKKPAPSALPKPSPLTQAGPRPNTAPPLPAADAQLQKETTPLPWRVSEKSVALSQNLEAPEENTHDSGAIL